jgi:hypothetical protein
MGFDTRNEVAEDPRFCIALDLSEGYGTSIAIECGEGEPPRMILMDYDHLPVRSMLRFAFLKPTKSKNVAVQVETMQRGGGGWAA